MQDVAKELALPDGGSIVLLQYERCGSEQERQHNVLRLDRDGNVIWRLKDYRAQAGLSTFTNVYFTPHGELRGYNFDGGLYGIDVATGECQPLEFLK